MLNKGAKKLNSPKTTKDLGRLVPYLLTFLILSVFWLVFSGKYDLFHLVLGLFSCVVVTILCTNLLFPYPVTSRMFRCWPRFISYLPWLFYQIVLANIHLLYLTFHPNMKHLINPKIIRFNSRLKSNVSRTALANSITLTPGTITVFAGVMGSFAVHCIDDRSGRDLPGEMEDRIAKVFDEN